MPHEEASVNRCKPQRCINIWSKSASLIFNIYQFFLGLAPGKRKGAVSNIVDSSFITI
jgi:hypothetical protein